MLTEGVGRFMFVLWGKTGINDGSHWRRACSCLHRSPHASPATQCPALSRSTPIHLNRCHCPNLPTTKNAMASPGHRKMTAPPGAMIAPEPRKRTICPTAGNMSREVHAWRQAGRLFRASPGRRINRLNATELSASSQLNRYPGTSWKDRFASSRLRAILCKKGTKKRNRKGASGIRQRLPALFPLCLLYK